MKRCHPATSSNATVARAEEIAVLIQAHFFTTFKRYTISSYRLETVTSLIGLHASAPYFHDGGVAASAEALKQEEDGYYSVADADRMGRANLINQIE